jgi:hypothetical protein
MKEWFSDRLGELGWFGIGLVAKIKMSWMLLFGLDRYILSAQPFICETL